MGRRRTKNLHLPEHVYVSRGWHFWVDPATGEWHKLGKEWDRTTRLEWVRISTGKAPDQTVAALLDAYYAHLEELVRANDGSYSARSLEVNDHDRAALKDDFGRMHYGDVTSKHIATFLKKRKDKKGRKTPVRANRIMAFMSSAYSWGMGQDEYDITVNPCYGVRRNPERPRKRHVETAELRRFVKGERKGDELVTFVPRWVRCYALLKRLTAMRQGNILALNDDNLTERGIRYRQNKRGPLRLVRWSWALRIVVKAALDMRAPPAIDPATLPANVKPMPRPLFLNRYESQMTRSGFKSMWQRGMIAFAEAGFARFTEHDLRAKAGSDAESDERAAELLGDSVKTTKKHYRRREQTVRPAR